MFDLKRPCNNCPFRTDKAALFALHPVRLEEIRTAVSFTCHKTVDYSGDDPTPSAKAQQCAGLMAVLHAEGQHNTIMQVAGRLAGYDPGTIDTTHTFKRWADVLEAHKD